MLRFFRINDPYRLLFVLAVVIILGLKAELEFPGTTLPELKGLLVGEMMADGKSMYSEVWDSMPPITAFVQYLFDMVAGRATLPRHIFSVFIIFLQAAFFGIILINNKAFNESNYLPSLLMAALAFFSFDTISLTREIIGSTFLLLAINNLLKEIEFKRQRDETMHNLGLYTGLASLSVFSYLVFFVGIIFLLFIFTRVEIRRFILFLVGFLLPHFILIVWYFWYGNLSALWNNFYLANLEISTRALVSISSLFYLCLIPLFYFLLSLLMMRREARLTKYQSQISQVMFFWFVFGLIEIWLTAFRTPQSFLVCAPPLAYFLNHYLLLTRRKWIAELLLMVLFTGLIVVNSLSVRNWFAKKIDHSAMFVTDIKADIVNKKVLVLDDDVSLYQKNKPSTYVLDWALAKLVFENASYQNIVTVDRMLSEDAPEIIIDPENLMEKFWPSIPDWKKKYKKEGNIYREITSSSNCPSRNVRTDRNLRSSAIP